ncbi:MAG: GNAT family N-acetyltransferase [Micromonosporaceae bacterium]
MPDVTVPRIVGLHDVAQHHAVADLFRRIWLAESVEAVLNPHVIRALAHAGNYVVGAYAGQRLVGGAVAFFGTDHLHSHIAGVDPAWQRAGVGYAIKQHQRAWALERGITRICWTFDPLVRRNARFNLHRLGALATEYLPDFYGAMTDGLNAGQPSDRLWVTWALTSPRAAAAARGEVPEVDTGALRAAGAAVLLDRAGQRPVEPVEAGDLPADGRPVLVAVPEEVEALRAEDPPAATAWRYALRDALGAALGAGYRITGMSRDGFYLLEVPEP